MPKQVFEKLEFSSRQLQVTPASSRLATRHIHFQIGKPQRNSLFASPASEEGSNARQKLRERKRFNEVIVGTFIESFDSVWDCITSGQDENRRLQSTFSQCGQHLQTITSRKHEIQNDQVEFLRINKKESFLSGRCNDNFIFRAF